MFSPTLIKPVGCPDEKRPYVNKLSDLKPSQSGDIGRQQLFNKLMELITKKRDSGLNGSPASDAHSNESLPPKMSRSPQDSKAGNDL